MGGFLEKNQKTPSNFIFYPKVCYHLSRYSPGNIKKLGRVALYKVIEKNDLYCPLLVIGKYGLGEFLCIFYTFYKGY